MDADALARFIALPENRAALQAVEQLAAAVLRADDSPLLFLHGPPGSGKSHLIGGLVERVSRGSTRKTALSVAAAEFGRTLLQAPIERREITRDAIAADLFIVEDVQHLPPAAGEELAAVLDRRQARRKPSVVTSVRGPADLVSSARLAGRLAGGLVVGIRPLAEASRRELAAVWCEEKRLRVTDEVIVWLSRDPGGARPILGDIARLEQLAKVHRPPLTLTVVTGELPVPEVTDSPMGRVVEKVAAKYRVSQKAILGPSRIRNVAHARQLTMYLGRQLGLSLVEIARHLGGRDHTTVMHGCAKIEGAIAKDPQLAQELRDLVSALR
jgi:chromosomal replication initiator protein